MNRICPHCGHARQDNDRVPDWQCPNCEKAYSKAGGPPPESFRTYGQPVGQARSGGSGKWLLLLVLAAVVWFGRPLLAAKTAEAAGMPRAGQPEVHLYATDWCGYCKATRKFFRANGIRYVEHDIEKDEGALQAHRELGGNGVPLVVIGDEIVHGYNEAMMRELLQPWLKR